MSGTSVGENLEYGNGLPPIKVVIPALNEEKNVGRLIDQIMAENVPCDIVVSDNASEDGTGKVVLERQARYIESRPEVAIELVYVPERGVAIARNVGALHGWNKKNMNIFSFLMLMINCHQVFFIGRFRKWKSRGWTRPGACFCRKQASLSISL